MKKVVIVTSHFPPSNLTAVHRSRLWATHLPEFDWEPVIVTCHYRYYEEKLDYSLYDMLPKWLRVIRVAAFKTQPVRIIGDAGMRAFYMIYMALKELFERDKFDFLIITIPSNFLAPLGILIKAKFGIAYGIDYIDPWVHDWPGSERVASKHWFSRRLSDLLEPPSVDSADLITGINQDYFSGMLERNPAVKSRAYITTMPYGFSNTDFIKAETVHDSNIVTKHRSNTEGSGKKVWVYAGAFLPKSEEVYCAFFKALALMRESRRLPSCGLKLLFIGTGKSPTDETGHQILPLAKSYGIEDLVCEHPHRMNYIEVLSCLKAADGILIIGSTEKHYSPSKIYQALMSGRPIWAALHKNSTAWQFLLPCWGCDGVMVDSNVQVDTELLMDSLDRALNMKNDFSAERIPLNDTEINARNSAKKLASALNHALA